MVEILDPISEFKRNELAKISNDSGTTSELEQKIYQFCKKADYVCEKIANSFSIEKEDLFKKLQVHVIVFPRQLCHYQISEENKKIFDNEYWALTARLFDTEVSTVRYNYRKIEGWKDLPVPTPECEKVKEVLGLFQYSSN